MVIPGSEDERRLVQSLVDSGKISAAQAQALVAETVRGGPPLQQQLSKLGLYRPPPVGWSAGAQVGAYRLESCLGRGGAGEVWCALHLPTGARRALKTLLPFAEPDDRRRFLREAQALARLDGHPNVVRIHESGEVEQRAYLAMDLALPDDLNQRLKAGPLPPDEAHTLLVSLAEGLAHVHAFGLLHRDLKPHNVLFADDGRPLLSDFGLVRGPSRTSLSITGELLGTPAYMAPEQALGEPVDERTDLYGLGALLYHVLCGRPPFQGQSAIVVLQQVIQNTPKPPSAHAPNVPPDLERVCMRALAKDPNHRYPNARALIAALTEQPAPSRWPLAAGALIVLTLGIAGGVWARTLTAPGPQAALQTASVAPEESLPTSSETSEPSEKELVDFLESLDLSKAASEIQNSPLSALYSGLPESPDALRVFIQGLHKSALKEISARSLAALYAALAQQDAEGWVEFVDYLSRPDVELDLPRGVTTQALQVHMLRRGVKGGSRACMRRLGQWIENQEGELQLDPDRVFELYYRGRYTSAEARNNSVAHALHAVEFALDPPKPFAQPPDPEQLLELVELALKHPEARENARLQRALCEARLSCTREVGERAFEALKATLPDELDWPLVAEAYPDIALLGGPETIEGATNLWSAGQHVDLHGRDNPDVLPQAGLMLLRAAEAGMPIAYSDLGNFALRDAALGTDRQRRALNEFLQWRGVEAGDSRAIGDLGMAYMDRARTHAYELEHVRQIVLHALPQPFNSRLDPKQCLRFALLLGEFAVTARELNPHPKEYILEQIKIALTRDLEHRHPSFLKRLRAAQAELQDE